MSNERLPGLETARLSKVDMVRRDWYLARLSLHIVGLPHKLEKSIRQQLRVDISDAAADQSMSGALAELGPPRVLAHEYLSAYGRPVPKVWTAIVVFALMLYGGLFALISVLDGLVDGALAADPHATVEISKAWLASRAEVTITDGIIESMGFTITGLGIALLIVVPLVAARVWRALPSRKRPN